MMALDTVSLVLSNHTPVVASLTISPALREQVPLGTLGADRLAESTGSPEQKERDRRVAFGWKLMALEDSVDMLLGAATRLEKEIEKEAKYWEDILAVDKKGWAICRLPQEPHTLGVRYGFQESAPAFSSRSLGALRRNDDGTAYLDQGLQGSSSKRLRVRIIKDGETAGMSSRQGVLGDDASLESLILNARDTLFEEELWQELHRESRILGNQGVKNSGSEIYVPITPSTRLVLDLVNFGSDEEVTAAAIGLSLTNDNDNDLATLVSLGLRILLSHAHKTNALRRSQPPPPMTLQPPPKPAYTLLRPVIAQARHVTTLNSLTALLRPLYRALKLAGLVDRAFTITAGSLTTTNNNGNGNGTGTGTATPSLAGVEGKTPYQILNALTGPHITTVSMPLTSTPEQSLNIQISTLPSLETVFSISWAGDGAVGSAMARLCKPPPRAGNVEEVKRFVTWATACAVASSFTVTCASGTNTSGGDGTSGGNGNALAHSGNEDDGEPAMVSGTVVDEEGSDGDVAHPVAVDDVDSPTPAGEWQPTHDQTMIRKLPPITSLDGSGSKEIAFFVATLPSKGKGTATAKDSGKEEEEERVEIRAIYGRKIGPGVERRGYVWSSKGESYSMGSMGDLAASASTEGEIKDEEEGGGGTVTLRVFVSRCE